MLRPCLRLLLCTGLILAVISGLAAQDVEKDKGKEPKAPEPQIEVFPPGQEYRNFFKKPTNTAEFWSAMEFEIEVGRYDLAAKLMRGLLALPPSDDELVKLHDKDGIAPFLKLRTIRNWIVPPPYDETVYLAQIDRYNKEGDLEKASLARDEMDKRKKAREAAIRANLQSGKDVEELVKRVLAAVKKKYSDPERIAKYIRNLKATPEERDFAVRELYRSGALAAPYLIAELHDATDEDRVAILYALSRLSNEIIPPLVAALDSKDARLVSDLIDLLVKRNATEMVPSLWFLSAAEGSPPSLRRKALATLAAMLGEKASRLTPAKVALTNEAENYFQHKVRFADPNNVPLWRWDGTKVTVTSQPATKVEEYYGIKWANQALQLDPTYQPAQNVLLSLLLEKTYEQPGALALPLAQFAPDVHNVLSTTRPELLTAVLDRAMTERRIPVILGTIRALGQLSEVRAIRPEAQGASSLVRALNFPDRRVHFAAAEAIVNIPGAASTEQTTRIVEIFRRALAAEPSGRTAPRVIVAYFQADLGTRIATALKEAGFDPIRVSTGRELMRRLNTAADVDAIVMEETLPDPELPALLAQLRADRNAGHIPILLTVSREREERLRRYVANYKNVTVILTGFALSPADLQELLTQRNVDSGGTRLTNEELKEYSEKAAYYLGRMAAGDPPGFDVRSTAGVAANVLRGNKLSPNGQLAAVELLARSPTATAQSELANVVLDAKNQPFTRVNATSQLVRHIQKHSLLLSREVIGNLENLAGRADTDPNLKSGLAVLIGAFRPDPRTAGERLLHVQPKVPAAPPLPPIKDPKEPPM